MDGIFGDLFGFNKDGQLDRIEKMTEFIIFEEMIKENHDDSFAEDDNEA